MFDSPCLGAEIQQLFLKVGAMYISETGEIGFAVDSKRQ